MGTMFLILAVAFVLSWIPAGVVYLLARRREAGERVITCPETLSPEVVRVDAGHAAWTDLRGEKELRLESCSRWPEKADCGQDCIAEIECAADGCLVRRRLELWYRDASCALCGMGIEPITWFSQRPGLRSPAGRAIFWEEIKARDLPAALATHQAICSDCLIAESFRERFPDRFVDDPWHTVDRRETRSPGPMA
jgi:hypothetical protein